jgi:hypothetical protein
LSACDSGPTPGASCADLAAAQCTKLQTCSSGDLSRRYGTLDVCKTRVALGCVASANAPQTSRTIDQIKSCGASLGAQSCADFLNNVLTDACTPKPGPRVNGQPCVFSAQCASAFCAVPDGSACGSCADLPKAGDSCATFGCGGRGLGCVTATLLCQPVVALNGACDRDHPCADGLGCVGSTRNTMGTCQSEGTAVGATCDANRRTASDCQRDQGLYCNATTNLCAMTTLVDAPMQCGLINGVLVQCQNTAACWGASGTTAGTCKADVPEGSACDTVNGPSCLLPARCVGMGVDGGATGMCVLPDGSKC